LVGSILRTSPRTRPLTASRDCSDLARWSRSTRPAPTTRAVPPAMVLRTAASVTDSNGGVSMITMSKRDCSSRRVLIVAAEPSSSLGVGGTEPEPIRALSGGRPPSQLSRERDSLRGPRRSPGITDPQRIRWCSSAGAVGSQHCCHLPMTSSPRHTGKGSGCAKSLGEIAHSHSHNLAGV